MTPEQQEALRKIIESQREQAALVDGGEAARAILAQQQGDMTFTGTRPEPAPREPDAMSLAVNQFNREAPPAIVPPPPTPTTYANEPPKRPMAPQPLPRDSDSPYRRGTEDVFTILGAGPMPYHQGLAAASDLGGSVGYDTRIGTYVTRDQTNTARPPDPYGVPAGMQLHANHFQPGMARVGFRPMPAGDDRAVINTAPTQVTPAAYAHIEAARLGANAQRDVARMHYGPDAITARLTEDAIKSMRDAGFDATQISQRMPGILATIHAAVNAMNGGGAAPTTPAAAPAAGAGAAQPVPRQIPAGWRESPNVRMQNGHAAGPSAVRGMVAPDSPIFNPDQDFNFQNDDGIAASLDRLRIMRQRNQGQQYLAENWGQIRPLLESRYGPADLTRYIYGNGLLPFSEGQTVVHGLDATMTPEQRQRLLELLPATGIGNTISNSAARTNIGRTLGVNVPTPPNPYANTGVSGALRGGYFRTH